MALSFAEQVKQTFNLIALRSEAMARLTGRQWEKRGALVDRCEKAQLKAEELHYKRYPARVAAVQKKLIDKAGAKALEHRPRFAQEDRFDKAETLRLAQQAVKDAHGRRMAQISEYERDGLSTLLSTAKQENRLQGKAERAFDKVADRRSSSERRQMHHLKRDR